MNNFISNAESHLAREIGEAENLIHHPLYATPWFVAEVRKGLLWRCAWPDAQHLAALKALGVKVVVNFCSERSQDALVIAAGMIPKNIPVMDNTVPTMAQLQEWLAIKEPKVGHCELGHGRTGCFMAGERVFGDGWTEEEALAEAEHYGLSLPAQKDFILNLPGGGQERG